MKTIEGNLMLKPTSRVIEDGYDFSMTQSGLAEVDEKIKYNKTITSCVKACDQKRRSV